MREPDFRGRSFGGIRWSLTLFLIVCYVVVLAVEQIAFHFYPYQVLEWVRLLALSKEGLARGYAWQLITYQFLHAGWIHLILNSWALYVFGRHLESVLGGGRYLMLLFSSGVVGGLLQVAMAMVLPNWFGGGVVGASAGVFGLVATFAMMFPQEEFTMLVFFVIPITMLAKRLLIFSLAFAVAGCFFRSNIANAAHLGGMLAGIAWVKLGWHHDYMQLPWEGLAQRIRNLGTNRRAGQRRVLPGEKYEDTAGDTTPGTDFLKDEVDAILDKISAHGIQSLTANERSILESARKKMSRK